MLPRPDSAQVLESIYWPEPRASYCCNFNLSRLQMLGRVPEEDKINKILPLDEALYSNVGNKITVTSTTFSFR